MFFYPLRRILQLVLLASTVACSMTFRPSRRGAPSPSWEFPGADPATGLTSS